LPKDTAILVCLWSEGEAPPSLKAVLEQAQADAYATSLPEAVELCIEFAKGERGKKVDLPEPAAPVVPAASEIAAASTAESAVAAASAAAPPRNGKKQPATPRKPQTASA